MLTGHPGAKPPLPLPLLYSCLHQTQAIWNPSATTPPTAPCKALAPRGTPPALLPAPPLQLASPSLRSGASGTPSTLQPETCSDTSLSVGPARGGSKSAAPLLTRRKKGPLDVEYTLPVGLSFFLLASKWSSTVLKPLVSISSSTLNSAFCCMGVASSAFFFFYVCAKLRTIPGLFFVCLFCFVSFSNTIHLPGAISDLF